MRYFNDRSPGGGSRRRVANHRALGFLQLVPAPSAG
jgi:hypothetical protein